MSYKTVLPEVFPISITVTREMAQTMAIHLSTAEERLPNGSSFAVTADTVLEGYCVVWLSAVSVDRINKSGILKQD
jgi:hypothetical protein